MPQVPNCYCQTEKCKMCVWSLVFLETSAAFSKYIQLLGVTWMMLRRGEEREGGLLRQKADTWVQLGERACAAWSCSLAGKGWVKVLEAHGTARSFWSMNTKCRVSLLCYVNGFGSASTGHMCFVQVLDGDNTQANRDLHAHLKSLGFAKCKARVRHSVSQTRP